MIKKMILATIVFIMTPAQLQSGGIDDGIPTASNSYRPALCVCRILSGGETRFDGCGHQRASIELDDVDHDGVVEMTIVTRTLCDRIENQ